MTRSYISSNQIRWEEPVKTSLETMAESITEEVEYKVIEPVYVGNAVEGLEKELNAAGVDGWSFAGVVSVREADPKEKTVSSPVQVVVLERIKS